MNYKPELLLIDADIFIYKAAINAQEVCNFGSWHVQQADLDKGIRLFENQVQSLCSTLKCNNYILALSSDTNFRVEILPSYKSNREGKNSPIIRDLLKDKVREHPSAKEIRGLEGDDILGIKLTDPNSPPYTVCCSIDKDLNTIPGTHYNWDRPDEGIYNITEETARKHHLFQTLVGDPVDGYKGCPGIGKLGALKILNNDCSWEAVVNAYVKKGLTESDALIQARVAHICRYSDYGDSKIIYWKP